MFHELIIAFYFNRITEDSRVLIENAENTSNDASAESSKRTSTDTIPIDDLICPPPPVIFDSYSKLNSESIDQMIVPPPETKIELTPNEPLQKHGRCLNDTLKYSCFGDLML
jgi:hypothetical protein